MRYREFSDNQYTDLRKRLLKEKGSETQIKLLEALKDKDAFVSYMDSEVPDYDNQAGKEKFDLVSDNLSEAEFKEPPKSIEKELYELWSDLTPAQASQETFWGYVTLEHIRKDVIQPAYLAANGGTLPGGLERIDKALNENTGIDEIVRTALRRLSGLPEARGSKSVYVNCPFARAWWRGYIANQVCQETDAERDKVIKVLSSSPTYWEGLIVLIVSRNSVLGDTKIRSALIWALSELVDNQEYEKLFVGKQLKMVSRRIGIQSAWQELAVFSVEELRDMVRDKFISI